MKKEIKIDGMHCEHCVARVDSALAGLNGVNKVKVNLKKGLAKIECEDSVADDAIKAAVADLGFTVTAID